MTAMEKIPGDDKQMHEQSAAPLPKGLQESGGLKLPSVVEVMPTSIWIESGFSGERIVMMQHEGCEPFEYAVFGYDYRYTSNAGTFAEASKFVETS